MTEIERAGYLAHSMTKSFESKVKYSLDLIDRALLACHKPYVATSFGKDSNVLLHLVMRHKPGIEARFIRWPETNLLDDYEAQINYWEKMGANIKILDLTRQSLDDSVSGRWIGLRNMGESDAVFMGLRAQESHARKMTLRSHGDIFRYKDGFLRVNPIAWWSEMDVAAYTVAKTIPLLDMYERHGFGARTSSRVPRKEVRADVLRQFKKDNPKGWIELIKLYPESEKWADL